SLVVVDHDVVVLSDVETRVGERPGTRVAAHAPLRRADGKDRVGVVVLRRVAPDAEPVDAGEVDAETLETLNREAAHLDVMQPGPRDAARRQLDIGRFESVPRRRPDALRLRSGLLDHHGLSAARRRDEVNAALRNGERAGAAGLVVRAGPDEDSVALRRRIEGRLDRLAGRHHGGPRPGHDGTGKADHDRKCELHLMLLERMNAYTHSAE